MHPLDNPIWSALATSLASLAQACGSARKFPSDISTLAAFREPQPDSKAYDSLATLLQQKEVAALLLLEPVKPPAGWIVVSALPLLQMVHQYRELPPPTLDLVELSEADVPEMIALTGLTQPGPFSSRTRELGAYLGIRRQGQLVAMAGERLRMPGYTEVSAVCTHPHHSGRGYAAALVSALIGQIRARHEVPFLHVRPDNQPAIGLYEKLGFAERRFLHLGVLRRSS